MKPQSKTERWAGLDAHYPGNAGVEKNKFNMHVMHFGPPFCKSLQVHLKGLFVFVIARITTTQVVSAATITCQMNHHKRLKRKKTEPVRTNRAGNFVERATSSCWRRQVLAWSIKKRTMRHKHGGRGRGHGAKNVLGCDMRRQANRNDQRVQGKHLHSGERPAHAPRLFGLHYFIFWSFVERS